MVQRRASSLAIGLWWLVLPAAAALVLSSCSASDGGATATSASPSVATVSSKYPNAIVVLGHSGTTGFNSDPSEPDSDARGNSWATGDNAAVNSIYARLLALNPAVRGHNTNFGIAGTNTYDLGKQVDRALALKPLPDLFMIQEVDNDIKCDGTDPDNYQPVAETMSEQLTKITAKVPKAIILLVGGPPGTINNYGTLVSHLPGSKGKAANTGTGPCDLFSPSGKAVPAHWRYAEKVTLAYQAGLATVCKQFPTCIYDGAALYRMVITAADLSSDDSHLSIAGLRRQAALEWRVLGLDS
jgi:lysophospholipase L1-like esterase